MRRGDGRLLLDELRCLPSQRENGDVDARGFATGRRQFDEVRPVAVANAFQQIALPPKRTVPVNIRDEFREVIEGQ